VLGAHLRGAAGGRLAAPAPDLVARNFTPDAPDQLWARDVTYLRTRQGWLYLATVIDLYSRRVIGWALAEHLRAELVCDALKMAIAATRGGRVDGVVFHSESGRTRARCRPFGRSVSLVRPPNRTCDFHRIRLRIRLVRNRHQRLTARSG
jgi:transposase InsO family protein